MKTLLITYRNVNPDGSFASGEPGSVMTKPFLRMSKENGRNYICQGSGLLADGSVIVMTTYLDSGDPLEYQEIETELEIVSNE